jgi:AcrR family transcriptional regulator
MNPMARWAPDAAGRLGESALELFATSGFAQVTVEQIAAHAGVTERTFYRHYPTKEDVLFSDGAEIISTMVAAVRKLPPEATPRELMLAAMVGLGDRFQPERKQLRLRATAIGSDDALKEREMLKRQHIAAALVDEFTTRKMPLLRANALAGTGLAVFQAVYAAWLTDRSRLSLSDRLRLALEDLETDLGTAR